MDEDLREFLDAAGLPYIFLEDGMTIDVLLEANENELSLLTSKISDRIKLRVAVQKLRDRQNFSLSTSQIYQPTLITGAASDYETDIYNPAINAKNFNSSTTQIYQPTLITSTASDFKRDIYNPAIEPFENADYNINAKNFNTSELNGIQSILTTSALTSAASECDRTDYKPGTKLSSDFQRVHPSANQIFLEKFPIIKLKLLKLLTEKGESGRVDPTTLELLELTSMGEEQANVAAFLATVTLLRQMPTICVPKKKKWKLSREEASQGFLGCVSTFAEIDTFCVQKEFFCNTKGIPKQPFILAVGPTWSNIVQYEIVINSGLRYQLPNICSAVMHTFNIYWALDCAYPRESAPCWMLIQRAIFQISSKFYIEGVPLRELLQQLEENS